MGSSSMSLSYFLDQGFIVPPEVSALVEFGIIHDIIWTQDVGMSFALGDVENDDCAQLMIQHPDIEKRECGGPQFCVFHSNTGNIHYTGDSLSLALGAMLYACPGAFNAADLYGVGFILGMELEDHEPKLMKAGL